MNYLFFCFRICVLTVYISKLTFGCANCGSTIGSDKSIDIPEASISSELNMEARSLTSTRYASKLVKPEKYKEGAGFIVNRPIGGRQLDVLDPFLLLDHFGPVNFNPGEAVGAPWHPHRGFETVSYILQGELQHRDSMGNSGFLRSGDVQWMTAGSGIIHDEEPSKKIKEEGGTSEGFQVWVNLPKKDKMCRPNYQDVSKDKIPVVTKDGVTVKVIAGEAYGTKAIVTTKVPIQYLDFFVEKGKDFTHSLPSNMNAGAYVIKGKGVFGSNKKTVDEGHLVVLDSNGQATEISGKADDHEDLRFLLLAGVPLNEPIARYGPFVMNTQEEIGQAFEDYQNGKLAIHQGTMQSKTTYDTNP